MEQNVHNGEALLLCFNHDAESDSEQPGSDDQDKRERADASFLEECIQRAEDDHKNTNVPNRFTEQLLRFALVDHCRSPFRGGRESRGLPVRACNQTIARGSETLLESPSPTSAPSGAGRTP